MCIRDRADHLAADFKKLGVSGYSHMRTDGVGAHGPRTYGVLDGANVRFEIVGSADLVRKVLAHVVTELKDRAVTAYAMDVEAVPADHFGG